jgi:hypothetical protein
VSILLSSLDASSPRIVFVTCVVTDSGSFTIPADVTGKLVSASGTLYVVL